MNFFESAGSFKLADPSGNDSLPDAVSAPAARTASDIVTIDDAHLLFSGNYERIGLDLILSDSDHRVVVHDYFRGDKRPILLSREGAPLDAKVIEAMVGHTAYAQAAGPTAATKVIGHAVKITGNASIVRNGVSVALNDGDNIYQGDLVQTGSGSTLGVLLIDGTTFNMSANARLLLNDLVYDPNSTSNSSLTTLVQGAVSFVAGQVAKSGDMKVATPIATMGIRGTAVILDINAVDGKVSISVVDQRDNQLHSVQVYDRNGTLIGTVTSNGSTLTLTPTATFEVLSEQTSKTAPQIAQEFGVFQQVLSTYDIGKQLVPSTPAPTDGRRGDVTTQSPTKFAGSPAILPSQSPSTTVFSESGSRGTAGTPTDDTASSRQQTVTVGATTRVADAPTATTLLLQQQIIFVPQNPVVQPTTVTVDIPATVAPIPFVVVVAPITKISSGSGNHVGPVISADGRFVTYDPDGVIYLYDRQSNSTTTIASPAAGFSYVVPTISSDGRFIVYQGTNGTQSFVFIYNNDATDPNYKHVTQFAAGGAPAISGDGSTIVVETSGQGIVVYDRTAHVIANITPASIGSSGTVWKPAVSGDGHVIAFWAADSAAAGGTGRLFAYDLSTGSLAAIASTVTGAGTSAASFSADGHRVVYQATAQGGHSEIYLYDLNSKAVIFHTASATGASYNPVISPDGNYIIFASSARLMIDDTNTVSDAYVVDVSDPANPTYRLVSALTDGTAGDAPSDLGGAISAGGLFVAFGSSASNLSGNTGGTGQIFVADPSSGRSAFISESATSPATLATSGMIAITGGIAGEHVAVSQGQRGTVTATIESDGNLHWTYSVARSDFAFLQPGQLSTQNVVFTLTTAGSATTIPLKISVFDADRPTVTVANVAPMASAVALGQTAEDTSVTLTAAKFLAGVSDINLDSISIGTVTVNSGGGTLVDNHNGTYTYTPAPNYAGPVVFSYTASDGSLAAHSTATLAIAAVNDAPVVTAAALSISEGGTVVLGLSDIGVADPDSDDFSFAVTNVTHGSFQTSSDGLTWSNATQFTTAELAAGQVRFVHDGGTIAPTFSIQADDGATFDDTSNVFAGTIGFTNVNHAPTILPSTTTTLVGVGYSAALQMNFLAAIDPNTGVARTLGSFSFDSGSWNPETLTSYGNHVFAISSPGPGTTGNGSLYEFDASTGLVKSFVPIGASFQAVRAESNGTLVGVGYDASIQMNFVATIDPNTGAAHRLGSFAFDSGSWNPGTLTVSGNHLYAISSPTIGTTGNGSLYDIDLTTGTVISFVPAGASFQALRVASDGTLVGVGYDASIQMNFVATVDPGTGAAHRLASFAFDSGFWSPLTLRISDNDLYAVSGPAVGTTGNGSLYDFDLATGAIKSVVPVGVQVQALVTATSASSAVTASGSEGSGIFTVNLLRNAFDQDQGAVLHVANLVRTDTGSGLPSGVTVAANGSSLQVDTSNPAFNGLAQGASFTAHFAYDVVDEHGALVHQTASVTIVGTNDAPVVTAAILTISEGGTHVLSTLDIGVADPDSSTFAFAVTSVTHGNFQTSSDGVTWTNASSFTTAQLAAGHVRFMHDGGETAPTFSIQADDGASLNHASNVFAGTISFANVNDPPTIAGPNTGMVYEDGTIAARSVSHQFTSSDPDDAPAPLWTVDGGATPQTPAYSFRINEFKVTRTGGGAFTFDDSFTDGNAPPAAPNFSVGGAANYVTAGAFTESSANGGFATLDSAHAALTNGVGTDAGFEGNFAILQTGTSAASANGLRMASDFTVEGTFDLIMPGELRQGYGIRLTDRTGSALGNDTLDLVIRKANNGVVAVQLRHLDQAGNTVTTVESIALNPTSQEDHILLRLSHAANSSAVTASFDLYAGSAYTRTVSFTSTDDIFHGENFTLASFFADSPSPTVSYLNGLYGTLSIDSTGAWNYSLNNGATAVQSLAEGQIVHDIFTVDASDGHAGGTGQRTLDITVVGKNDAPVVTSTAGLGAFSPEYIASSHGGNSAILSFGSGKVLVVTDDRTGTPDALGISDSSGAGERIALFDANGQISGSSRIINQNSSGDQLVVASAVGTDGTGLIVWVNPDGNGAARLIGAGGEPLGAEIQLAGLSSYVHAIPLDDGGFAIAGSANNFVDVSVTKINAAGQIVGTPYISHSGTYNEFVVKDVAPLNGGGYILFENGGGLVGQRIDANADAVGSSVQISSLASSISLYNDLAVTTLPDRSIFVTWSQFNPVSNSQDIFARFLNSDGTVRGPDFLVTTATAGTQTAPIVNVLTNGSVAVAWYDSANLWTRTLDQNGNFLTDALKVNTTGLALDSVHSTEFGAATPDGGIFYVWRGLDSDGEGVRGQHVDATGHLDGQEVLLNNSTAGRQILNGLNSTSAGQLFATWFDEPTGQIIVREIDYRVGNNVNLTVTNSALVASGTETVTDVDLTDLVTVSVAGVTHTGPTGGLSDATLLNYFHVSNGIVVDSTHTNAPFNWSFNSAGQAFNFLAAGETLSLHYTITPSDGHTPTGTGDGVVTVTITGTNNAAPVLDLDSTQPGTGSSGAAVADGNPVPLFGSHVTITDADNTTLQSARITLRGGGTSTDYANDHIDSPLQQGTSGLNWATTSGSSGIVVTVTGNASLANYQTLLQSFVFSTTSSSDHADRGITVTVNDGTTESAAATGTISVSSVPTSIFSFDLGLSPNLVGSSSDLPDLVSGDTVTRISTDGVHFTPVGAQSSVTNNTGTTIHGQYVDFAAGSDGTYGLVIRSSPNAAALIDLVEGNESATKPLGDAFYYEITSSSGAIHTVKVTWRLDDVTFSGTGSTPVSAVQGQAVALSGLAVHDAGAASAAHGPNDVITVALGVSLGVLNFDTTTFSSTTSGATTSGLTFVGTATQINADLAHVTYTANQTGLDYISISGIDGPVQTAGYIVGSINAAAPSGPVNHAPTITATPTGFDFGNRYDGTIAILKNVTVNDIDTTSFDDATLTIDVTAGGNSEDYVEIGNYGNAYGGGDTVYYDASNNHAGLAVGSLSRTSSNVTIQFNANASAAAIAALIENFRFGNESAIASSDNRTITFTLVDGHGTANGGHDAATVSAIVKPIETFTAQGSGYSWTDGANWNLGHAPLDGEFTRIRSIDQQAAAPFPSNVTAQDIMLTGNTIEIYGYQSSLILSGSTLSGVSIQTYGNISPDDPNVSSNSIEISGSVPTVFDGTGQSIIISNSTTVDIDYGSTLVLKGTIQNAGTILVDVAVNPGANLLIETDVLLNGGGTVSMPTIDSIVTGGTVGNAPTTLTNFNNGIVGAGHLGNGNLTINNELNGQIAANLSGYKLYIDTGLGTFTNHGLIVSNGSGGIDIAGDIFNDGTLQADDGLIEVHGAVTGGGTASVGGGTLQFDAAAAVNVLFSDGSSGNGNLNGRLVLADPSHFAGSIGGLTGGDLIDLASIAVTNISFVDINDGVEVHYGTGSSDFFTITGSYSHGSFGLLADGHGGTYLTVVDPVSMPSVEVVSTYDLGIAPGYTSISSALPETESLNQNGFTITAVSADGVHFSAVAPGSTDMVDGGGTTVHGTYVDLLVGADGSDAILFRNSPNPSALIALIEGNETSQTPLSDTFYYQVSDFFGNTHTNQVTWTLDDLTFTGAGDTPLTATPDNVPISLGALQVHDNGADTPSTGQIAVTVAVTLGHLSVSGPAISTMQLSPDHKSVTLSGSEADINSDLSRLQFASTESGHSDISIQGFDGPVTSANYAVGSIDVDHAPVAVDDHIIAAATAFDGGILSIDNALLTANDTDADNDALSVSASPSDYGGQQTYGSASAPHTAFTDYTLSNVNTLPTSPNAPLVDSFTYKAFDSQQALSNAGTVSVKIVAADNTTTTLQDVSNENDILFGGLTSAQDRFVFAQSSGHDTIVNFQSGTDTIDLTAYNFSDPSNAAWLTAHAQDAGSDTLIHLDATNFNAVNYLDTILVKGITVANLSANDFILHPTS